MANSKTVFNEKEGAWAAAKTEVIPLFRPGLDPNELRYDSDGDLIQYCRYNQDHEQGWIVIKDSATNTLKAKNIIVHRLNGRSYPEYYKSPQE